MAASGPRDMAGLLCEYRVIRPERDPTLPSSGIWPTDDSER